MQTDPNSTSTLRRKDMPCAVYGVLFSCGTILFSAMIGLYVCALVIGRNNEENPCLKKDDTVSVHYIRWLYIYAGTNLAVVFLMIVGLLYLFFLFVCDQTTPFQDPRGLACIRGFGFSFSFFMLAWLIYGAKLYWGEVASECHGAIRDYGLATFILTCISCFMGLVRLIRWLFCPSSKSQART